MIVSKVFSGRRFAVLGLARSGVATVRTLLASGAEVVAWDADAEKRDLLSPPEPPRGGEGHAGRLSFADPLAIDLAGFDGVVVSPGVPLNRHPIAQHAKVAGVPVIGDIELFAQARPSLPSHKVVGITGTNGKSTTTALVTHILDMAGMPARMGGNIGLPILGRDPLPPGGVYVLELSSYQIDLTRTLDCEVAVLLNVTPDHLDRYDGFDGYAASKARLFAMQAGGVAVIAVEDAVTRGLAAELSSSPTIPTAVEGGFSDETSRLRSTGPSTALGTSGKREVVAVTSSQVGDQTAWPALQGPHNAQNVAVATAVARALGIGAAAIARALESYPGLPHRMERIATRDGVLYVNDSKATNPTSTAPALAAYPRVHWILGGLAKTQDLDAVAAHLGHVVAGYAIGDSADLYTRLLTERGVPVVNAGTLAHAVGAARQAARAGEVVLLSPACASFDQFSDYEARGDAFRAAVESVP